MRHRISDALADRAGDAPPPFLDVRFDAAGRPLKDSGSTVIAHIRDAEVRAALQIPRERLAAEGLDRFWAWLPEASFHMTIFDLMLHARRAPDRWPAALPADATEAEADAIMLERMRGAEPGDAPPWHVAPRGVYCGLGVGVALAGADGAEERRLRALRDRLAEAAGLTHRPGHDAYMFHVTLAYLIAWPGAEEAARIDHLIHGAEGALAAALPRIRLGAPEVCLFQDMTAFRPQFTL